MRTVKGHGKKSDRKCLQDADRRPSEFTCRNHWHDIFGYRPDLARLKSREGREKRHDEHVKKYEAYKKNSGAKSEAELLEEAEAAASTQAEFEPSEPASSNSSVRNNSFVPSEESPYSDNGYLDATNFFSFGETSGYANSSMHPGNGGLAPVTEEEDGDQIAPDEKPPSKAHRRNMSRAAPSSEAQEKRVAKPGEKSAAQIEDKEGLPTGFLTAFKRMSFASSFASSLYAGSRNSSRTSFAIPTGNTPAPNGLFSYVSQKAVPKNAICSYLDNCSAVTNVPTDHIEELIQRGADVNACNRKGETPLHLAVKLGNIVIFSFLITQGANPNAKTRAGESIWKYGGKASKAILPPDKVYENKGRQLLDTMVCAHIEFLRATAKYNPDLVTDDAGNKGKKRRMSDDSIDFNKIGQRYRRSGAVGISEKRACLNDTLSSSFEEKQDFVSRLERISKDLGSSADGPVNLNGSLSIPWGDRGSFTDPFNGAQQPYDLGTQAEGTETAIPAQDQPANYDASNMLAQDPAFNVEMPYQPQAFDALSWPAHTPDTTGMNVADTSMFPNTYQWEQPKTESQMSYPTSNVAAPIPDQSQMHSQYQSTTPMADFNQAWPAVDQTTLGYDMSTVPVDSTFQRQTVPHLYQQTSNHSQSNLYQQLHQNNVTTNTQQYTDQNMSYQANHGMQQSRQDDYDIAKVEMELQEANAKSQKLKDKLNFLRAKASLRKNGQPNGSFFNPSSWGSGSGG